MLIVSYAGGVTLRYILDYLACNQSVCRDYCTTRCVEVVYNPYAAIAVLRDV